MLFPVIRLCWTVFNCTARCTVCRVNSSRAPGQRAGLSRERVIEAARELLNEGGTDVLSMRALADRLGVRPNAIYSHVENKAMLIDHLLDDVLAAVERPDPGTTDPVAGMYTLMASTYEVLVAHADLVALYLARQGARGPNAQQLGEVMLLLLGRIDITGQQAREALHVLIVYAIGSAAFATSTTPMHISPPKAAVESHADRFEHGLAWLLAGIAMPTKSAQS